MLTDNLATVLKMCEDEHEIQYSSLSRHKQDAFSNMVSATMDNLEVKCVKMTVQKGL